MSSTWLLPAIRLAKTKQIEDAAAHDPTKAGKIEFFMQYVGRNRLVPHPPTFAKH